MGLLGILLKNRRINLFMQKLFITLHSKSYHYVSILAVMYNGGVHPKHHLMGYHSFFLDNIKKGSKILDIGCGDGTLTHDIAKKASKVVAIDKLEGVVKAAEGRNKESNISYLHGDATNYEFREKFDMIILSSVLEAIDDRVRFLKKIKKLAPAILIRVPMINRDWLTLYKKELGMDWRMNKAEVTEFTVESLKEELRKSGLRLDRYSVQFGEIWGVITIQEAA